MFNFLTFAFSRLFISRGPRGNVRQQDFQDQDQGSEYLDDSSYDSESVSTDYFSDSDSTDCDSVFDLEEDEDIEYENTPIPANQQFLIEQEEIQNDINITQETKEILDAIVETIENVRKYNLRPRRGRVNYREFNETGKRILITN